MNDGPFARWPHAAFLLRLATHRAKPGGGNLIGILVIALALAAADARGYLRHVSLAIGLLLVMVATPQAAWVLKRFESAGYVDLIRLSGASAGDTTRALFLGLMAPILFIGLIFLGSGWAFGAVSNAEQVSVFMMFELITTATIGVLIGPRVLQRWAPQLLLTIAVGGAMAFAIVAEGRASPWTVAQLPNWPLIAIGIAVPLLMLSRALIGILHHAGQSSAKSRTARRIPVLVPFDVSPVFARSVLQAIERALVSSIASLAGIALAAVLANADTNFDVLVSLATYLPLPFALLVVFGESRLDTESDRVQFTRGAPIPGWKAATQSIAGWCLPFVIACLVSALTARIVFGLWPVFPLIALFATVMLAPAVAAEGWMTRSPSHLAAVACALPLVLVFAIADRPAIEQFLRLAPVAWVPLAAAIAAFQAPQRPAFAGPVAVATLTVTCGIGFYQLPFPLRARIQPHAVLMAAGLIMASPLLGSNRWFRRLVAPILVAGIGAFIVVFRGVPVWLGVSAIIPVALSLVVGGHFDRRYSGERVVIMRSMAAYVVVIGALLVPLALELTRTQLPAAATAITANLLAAALLVTIAIVALFFPDRSARRGITS